MALAKRKKKTKQGQKKMLYKMVAIPTNPTYEPWTLDILKYLQRHQARLNFDLTRQRIFQIVRKNLGDHFNGIHPHSLRHFRLTHLVSHYHFDPYDVTAFAGWSYSTGFGGMGVASSQLDTYLHLSWQKYYPKLLKPL